MPESNILCTRTVWQRQPVDKSKNSCQQPAKYTGGDHIKRCSGKKTVVEDQIQEIEYHCCGKKPQREDNQHWMHRMPKKLHSTFHKKLLPELFLHIDTNG